MADVTRFIPPSQIWTQITRGKSWPYRVKGDILEWYKLRDQALTALVYVGELRIREALGIRRSQFKQDEMTGAWEIQGVKLVKEKITRKGKPVPRKHAYRPAIYLPVEPSRRMFTDLIVEYLMDERTQGIPEDRLFNFKWRTRAYQIIGALTGVWCHFFRIQGENYRFRKWDKEIDAVAKYLMVDKRTLLYYLIGDFSDKPRV